MEVKTKLTEGCAAVCQARVSVAAGGGSGRRRQGAVGGRVSLVAVARTNTKRTGLGFTWLGNKHTGHTGGRARFHSEQSDNVWAQSALHSCTAEDALNMHVFYFFLLNANKQIYSFTRKIK